MEKLNSNGEKQPILRDELGRVIKGSGSLNPYGKNANVRHKASIVKEAFFQTFQEIGGMPALVKWVQESKANKVTFFKLLLSILPKDIDVTGNDVRVVFMRDVIIDGKRLEINCGDAIPGNTIDAGKIEAIDNTAE